MSLRLQLFLGAALIALLILLIQTIRRGKCNLRFALPWFALMFVLFVLDLFPELAGRLSRAFGIALPSNMLLITGIGVAFLLIFYLTLQVSTLTDRQRHLIQEAAMLKKKVEELEKELKKAEE